MDETFVMGNEAAAYGSLAAGVNLISGYPGTPSSELLETAARFVRTEVAAGNIPAESAPHVEWSVNEKAALEVAFGASIAGARALVTMKQVGLNVAADPLLTIATLGTKGGLVLFVADDPGPISSQNEQDTRQFAQFAKVPLLDAASPEELFSMMKVAFDISERHASPVILRATTRVCHGSVAISLPKTYTPHVISGFERDQKWVIFPPLAYKAHLAQPQRFREIAADRDFSSFNYEASTPFTKAEKGIVAGGISWCYLLDALEQQGLMEKFDLLKIGAPFPFADEMAAEFLRAHSEVLVLEELEPTLERELLRVAGSEQLNVRILGKLTGNTAIAGENSMERISADLLSFVNEAEFETLTSPAATHAFAAKASHLSESSNPVVSTSEGSISEGSTPEGSNPVGSASESSTFETVLPSRPPVLCAGCPHRASFYAVKKALRGKKATFSGDIGCYTLGNAAPLHMVDTCVCMGAGFTVPQGMYWAEPDVYHLGFVGDSTFFASGLTGVVNAVYNQAPITLIVLDNSVTAMTGSQPHPGTGMRMSFDASTNDLNSALSIPHILTSLGVKHVQEVNPLNLNEAITAVKSAVSQQEVSAVVFKAPCIKVASKASVPSIAKDLCTGCYVCIDSLGCPALNMDEDTSKIQIDEELCYGCDLCALVCPFTAFESNNKQNEMSNHA